MKLAIFSLCYICATLATPRSTDGSVKILATGNRLFTSDVFKESLKKNSPNIIFSPFSAETVLSLTSEGAKNETRSELIKALHLSEKNKKNQKAFKHILPKLKIDDKHVKLFSANKIYTNNSVTLEDAFKKIAMEFYGTEIENLNFSENIDSANKINTWVEDQTNEKIKNLVESKDINGDTSLILVNALYVSAKWRTPFHKELTKTQKFHKTASDSKDVQMMHIDDIFNYYENTELNTQFVELRFKHKGLSMVIALPKEIEGIASLENNLEEVFKPQPWKGKYIDIKLPRFTISSSTNFVNVLQSLGVNKLFDPINADLSGLSVNSKDVYVSKVIQKAFINVTESGTEAAAATAVFIEARMGRIDIGKINFHADHPFIFFIKYNDIILFAGKYSSE